MRCTCVHIALSLQRTCTPSTTHHPGQRTLLPARTPVPHGPPCLQSGGSKGGAHARLCEAATPERDLQLRVKCRPRLSSPIARTRSRNPRPPRCRDREARRQSCEESPRPAACRATATARVPGGFSRPVRRSAKVNRASPPGGGAIWRCPMRRTDPEGQVLEGTLFTRVVSRLGATVSWCMGPEDGTLPDASTCCMGGDTRGCPPPGDIFPVEGDPFGRV